MNPGRGSLDVRDELPIIAGVVPFEMIYGSLAVAAGMPLKLGLLLGTFAGIAAVVLTWRYTTSGMRSPWGPT